MSSAPSPSSIVPASSVTARMRKAYSDSRTELNTAAQDISDYVHKHTQQERARLEQALQALESKQQQLMQSSDMQQRKAQHQAALHKLEDMTLQIEDMQRKALRQIESLGVSMDEKRQLWSQVQDGVQTIMHSDDELKAIAEFKRQFQAMVGAGHGSARALLL